MLTITPVHAAVLAVLFVILLARVVTYRRGNRISPGGGRDAELQVRSRAQGIFAEYAPFGIALIALCEAGGTASMLIHGTGAALQAGGACTRWRLHEGRRSWPCACLA